MEVILLIDNYDSFVFNLARYFERLGQETQIVRNDTVDVASVERLRPAAVVLSPGPCTPREAGCSLDVVRYLHERIPILGVCLGHQAIGEALGGEIVRAEQPMHGRTSQIYHRGENVFQSLPEHFTATRYHSLVLRRETLPDCLTVTAWTSDGTIMGLAHRDYPVYGVQFHPESVLTDGGYSLLANFLRLADLQVPDEIPRIADECARASLVESTMPDQLSF